jgi:hypothetical protein
MKYWDWIEERNSVWRDKAIWDFEDGRARVYAYYMSEIAEQLKRMNDIAEKQMKKEAKGEK